eukprot:4991292-Amphidinium_carterae.1
MGDNTHAVLDREDPTCPRLQSWRHVIPSWRKFGSNMTSTITLIMEACGLIAHCYCGMPNHHDGVSELPRR